MQALRPGVQKSQDGSFRATFEDKPLMSDIVFLRAWIGVDLPKFYNPVTNLLAPAVRLTPRELKPGHMAAEVSLPSKMQQQHANSLLPSLCLQCDNQCVSPSATESATECDVKVFQRCDHVTGEKFLCPQHMSNVIPRERTLFCLAVHVAVGNELS